MTKKEPPQGRYAPHTRARRQARLADVVLWFVFLVAAFVAAHVFGAGSCTWNPQTGSWVCGTEAIGDYQPATFQATQSAAPAPNARPLPGRCRVRAADGSTGSGTLISPTEILTCSHVFDDSQLWDSSQRAVCVVYPDGQTCQATLLDRDQANDLALLEVAESTRAPVPVEGEAADAGQVGALCAGGFGGDGRFSSVIGQVVKYVTPAGASAPCGVMQGAVRPGDSGGGVLNAARRLVGVVWGARDGQTYVTCGRPIREFLARCRARRAAARQVPAPVQTPATAPALPAAQPAVGWTPASSTQPPASSCNCGPRLDSMESQLADLNKKLGTIDPAKFATRGELTPITSDVQTLKDESSENLSLLGKAEERLRQEIAQAAAGFKTKVGEGLPTAASTAASWTTRAVLTYLGLGTGGALVVGGLVGRWFGRRVTKRRTTERLATKPAQDRGPGGPRSDGHFR